LRGTRRQQQLALQPVQFGLAEVVLMSFGVVQRRQPFGGLPGGPLRISHHGAKLWLE
jgi:hypothetical protein